MAQLDALRAKAQAVKQLLPVPKYSGIQIMIGVEGTPAVTPVSAGGAASGPVANLKDEKIKTSLLNKVQVFSDESEARFKEISKLVEKKLR